MTHADAFVQAILDAPDDDAPRLLYADWLDEQGDPDRSEFIRVQIALDRGGKAPGLLARQDQLLTLHEEEWSAPVRGVASRCAFRRGFIEDVEATAQAFLDGAEELFRRVPVRRVGLRWGWGGPQVLWPYHIPRLAECPALERLSGLDLSHNALGSDGLQALLVSSRLSGLRELSVRECQIGDRGVRALAQSPLLTRLTRLDLSHNDVRSDGLRSLARALEVRATGGDPPRLNELLLHGNPLGKAGLRTILTSPLLRRAARHGLSDRTRPGPTRQ